MTIATTATDRTMPSTSASAAHGHDRRLSTGAVGATGRRPSASGRPWPTRSPSIGTSGTMSSDSASSGARETIGGAPDLPSVRASSLGTTAARLAESEASSLPFETITGGAATSVVFGEETWTTGGFAVSASDEPAGLPDTGGG